MNNEFKVNCKINVPVKYHHMINEIDYEGKDDGYWLYLNQGYLSENGYGSKTIHEYTKKDLLNAIRKIKKVVSENE